MTAIWGLALSRWLLDDLVVPWDSKNQFYAFFRFMASAIHSGSTPFWNPYHFAGHPSIADPQSLILALPFLVWAMADPAPSLHTFDTLVFAHLLVGGLAFVAYGRRHAWPAGASILAASVFMLGGAVSARMSHTGIVIAYGLFPLAVVLLEEGLARRSLWLAAALGAVVAQIALGRNQVVLLLCLALVVWTLAQVFRAGRTWREAVARDGLFLLTAGAVAAALLVAPLLLTLQFAALSNRPAIGLDLALMSSWYPVNLATMLVPNIFGSLEPSSVGDWSPNAATRPGLDFTDRAFNYAFLGSLTMLLVLWHGLAGGRAWRPGRKVLLAVAVGALLYALGRHTPVYEWLYAWVPGVKLFRRPVDALFVIGLALAFLAGHLLADHVREGAPATPRWALVLAAAVATGVVAWGIAFSAGVGKGAPSALAVGAVVPVYAGLIAALLLGRSAQARASVALGLALFTGGELVWRNAATSMNAEPRANYAVLEDPKGPAADILEAIDYSLGLTSNTRVRPRVEILGMGGAWQNAAMVFGYEATNGYNPLRIGAYDTLVAPGESPYLIEHRDFPVSFPSYDCTLSKLLGLEYLVFDRPIEKLPKRRGKEVAELIVDGPTAWIYRLRNPAPRVSLATRVRVADADAQTGERRFPASAGQGEVWVDDDDPLKGRYGAALATRVGRADIVTWRVDRITVEVDTPAAAVLTLNSLWYPGWQVSVNGERKPLLRANVLFRGVEVGPGKSRVTFVYRPFSLENLQDAARRALGRRA